MNYSIIIPTYNRADLLEESYKDLLERGWINHNNSLIIIDNGNQDLSFIQDKWTTIIKPGKNLGVSASWNKGLQTAFNFGTNSKKALVLNDDILLGKSPEIMEEFTEGVYTSNNHWCAFAITAKAYQAIGPFDENFYPAYFEDTDYERRAKLAGVKITKTELLDPEVFRNSQTIAKDPSVNKHFDKNKLYFETKWPNQRLPRVYEAFMYNGELEILIARIKQTYRHVESWFIIEGSHTFQGEPKKQYLEKDLQHSFFDNFRDRIKPVKVQMNPSKDAWANEFFLRNRAKQSLPKEQWCMLTDLDEIPDYDIMLPDLFKTKPDKEKVYVIDLWSQYYNPTWAFKEPLRVSGPFFNDGHLYSATGQQIRKRDNLPTIELTDRHAGWHISYFLSPEQIKEKIETFAHREMNKEEFKNLDHIKDCIANGKDLFGRPDHDMINTQTLVDYRLPSGFEIRPLPDSNNLRDLGLYYNTDKAVYHEYCEFYQDILPRNLKGNILEIGVNTGASLRMWASYYPDAFIEGWEINKDHIQGTFPKNAKVYIQDALKQTPDKHYDLIIDDGSHRWQDIIDTFHLFWNHTDIYIIEDIHTSNNRNYANGPKPPADPQTKELNLDFDRVNTRISWFRKREKDSWTVVLDSKS